MKKLMIAGLAAIAMGAFAEEACGLGESVVCAEVYDVKMTIKTTYCKLLYTPAKSDKCGLKTDEVCDCYREPVMIKVGGVIWSCACTCEDEVEGSTLSIAPEARWNLDYGEGFADSQLFWLAKQKTILEDVMTFTHLYRIGKNNKKVEAAGTFGPLTFAGFGTFATNKSGRGVVYSLSGGVAGLWKATPDCTLPFSWQAGSAPEEISFCLPYSICPVLEPTQLEDVEVTAAYGLFQLKYNHKKSQALAKGRSAMYGKVVPKVVFKYNVKIGRAHV